jgi:hypothetical protein
VRVRRLIILQVRFRRIGTCPQGPANKADTLGQNFRVRLATEDRQDELRVLLTLWEVRAHVQVSIIIQGTRAVT